ncbi:MAG: hypothetical protein WC641_06065 [Patescibacteria group bacterium]
MTNDVILRAIPHADPVFVEILSHLPEPPPGAYEQVVQSLPGLHDLFLRKRNALQKGDAAGLREVVEAELAQLLKLEKSE